MANNSVAWFEIYVQDMPRARKFYEAVFGVSLEQLTVDELEMWAFPSVRDGAGAAGALVKMDGAPSGGNSTIVYFICDDCAVEESRVAGHGGSVARPKFSIGEWGFASLVRDVDGNMIGLHSMK